MSPTRAPIGYAVYVTLALLILSGIARATTLDDPVAKAIQVQITTHLGDAQTFVEGDVLSFFISLDRNAYLYIVYEDASGNITTLMPNERQPDNFFNAGLFMPLPDPQQPFQFKIRAPFGEEKVWAFALGQAFESASKNTHSPEAAILANNIPLIREQLQQFVRQTGSSYGEALLRLHTAGKHAAP